MMDVLVLFWLIHILQFNVLTCTSTAVYWWNAGTECNCNTKPFFYELETYLFYDDKLNVNWTSKTFIGVIISTQKYEMS